MEGGRPEPDRLGHWLTDARAGIEIIQGLWAQIRTVDWKVWIPDLDALKQAFVDQIGALPGNGKKIGDEARNSGGFTT